MDEMQTTSSDVPLSRNQRTLKGCSSFAGIGIHTGKEVQIRFCPAKEGTGIIFKRVDVSGHPIIPATVEYVQDTSRSTTIGINDIRVHTVEHVLAAIEAYRIDNLCIELNGFEPPIGNGSSDVFVEMIEKAGIFQQEITIPIMKIRKPIYWSQGDIHLVALPYEGYRISYTLSYPDTPFLRAQFHSLVVNEESFKEEIASCRTFSLYKEISYLIDQHLIQGGSLDNAVVIKDDVVFSKGGLFFPNEMVRHKILDLIGDLSLVGFDFHAHIIAIRSGHASNFAFAQQILTHIMVENLND
jgi:UDP-3-O-[3-hydroxymyristoyl] N-acetylglucosamine deacetylase